MVTDETVSFNVEKEKNARTREILKDPTYITSHNNARNLIRQIERDELLEEMVKIYIGLEK